MHRISQVVRPSNSHSCICFGCLPAGRIPASFNGCVGVKPTVGRVTTTGVVPACRSLDCVSCFARSVDDGALVVRIMQVRIIQMKMPYILVAVDKIFEPIVDCGDVTDCGCPF